MELEVIDYNKTYAKEIALMLKKQWNVRFIHESGIVGKVATCDGKFAGVCLGCAEKDYFNLDILCIPENYRNMGIGTKLVNSFIEHVKHTFNKNGGMVKVYLLDNDGLGSNDPRAKNIFEKCGFKFIKIIPNFFAKDNNFDYCPDCNHKPCICAAWEYELKID